MNLEKLQQLDNLGITEITLANSVFESLVAAIDTNALRIITDTIYLKLASGSEIAIRRGY